MKVKSESEVAQSCLTLHNPMGYRLQAPQSMELTNTLIINFPFYDKP